MSDDRTTNTASFLLRWPERLRDEVVLLAALNKRPVAAEIRAALEAHVAGSGLRPAPQAPKSAPVLTPDAHNFQPTSSGSLKLCTKCKMPSTSPKAKNPCAGPLPGA